MQAVMETIFDIVYLCFVISAGCFMFTKSKGDQQSRLFGIMAIVLGCGDAFHLVPRVYSLITGTMDSNAAALGFGKLVTSITMTVFYVMLYQFWRKRFKVTEQKGLTYTIYILAVIRIGLCLFPQNHWLSADAPVIWGIYRNIPFAIIGIMMIYLFFQKANQTRDKAFKWAWLAILLSFAFYISVVLWADSIPIIGMLMLPKTIAYVWIVCMGFNEFRKKR